MKRLAFFIYSSIISCALALAADEPEVMLSMLEDGMVWSCAHLDHNPEEEPYYFTVTVVGDTIINGQECKKLIKTDSTASDVRIWYAYEENGIVYDYIQSTAQFYPYIDFNANAQDWLGVYNGSGKYFEDYFFVGASGYVDVGGVKRKVIAFGNPIDELPRTNLWIEGIGSTYGSLTMIQYPNHGDFSIMLECSKNGECLFKREDISDISNRLMNGEPIKYEPIVRHDRVWECIVREDNGDIHVDYLKFDEPKELLGKTYTRIVNFASLQEIADDSGSKCYSISDTSPSTFGFMREENAEAFTVIDEELKIYTDDFNSNPLEEVLIYKFNTTKNDLFFGATFREDRLQYGRFRVRYQEHQTIEGENNRKSFLYFHENETPARTSFSFSDRQFIAEGIGTGYYGCLCRPELDAHHECICFAYIEKYGEFRDHECDGQDLPKYTTNRVFDMAGNVIYTNPRPVLDIPYEMALSNVDICISDTKGAEWKIGDRHIDFISESGQLELTIYGTDGIGFRKANGISRVDCCLSDLQEGIYIAVAKSNGVVLSTKKICVR